MILRVILNHNMRISYAALMVCFITIAAAGSIQRNLEMDRDKVEKEVDEELRPDVGLDYEPDKDGIQLDVPDGVAALESNKENHPEQDAHLDVPENIVPLDNIRDSEAGDDKLHFDEDVVHLDEKIESPDEINMHHTLEVMFDESLDREVAPPDHIAAVKMERDGDQNSNYHKEVFLGKEMEKFKNGDYEGYQQKEKLKDIFTAVDLNTDGFLDEAELTDWVLTKTREHFYEARMNNEKTFRLIDLDGDEKVTWNEFISQFLSEKGMNKRDVYTQLDSGESVKVPEDLENKIQELREKWIQVQEVGKKFLTVSEFFDFQHPETSKDSLKLLVEDILHDMDTDNSNDITVQEYVAMAPNADVDIVQDIWVASRREEFRKIIDINKDGKVGVEELEAYLDPLSRTMAGQEARQLIGFGDTNEDGKLTLREILENSEFYTGSKLYNYAQSIHEEF
ncbi:45 kDa calcium-binding protein-like [Styela clava]|uniref:45 kDa calcium-binding protein-like n=1 Tax=Styela clava TaxID=7725 RepID=UPI00193AA3F0|nr:45 kDa calcium-binding protein-like [Styela clava]XP_039257432.1 45 kDa calcium-binding protein-like [Styela clava]